jgi:hypothetical protein
MNNRMLIFWIYTPCNIGGINPEDGANMEEAGSTETLANTANITWRINPEDQHLNLHCCEDLKSYSSVQLV